MVTMVSADLLIRDRLAEFQRLAQAKGTLQGDGDDATPATEGSSKESKWGAGAKLLGKGSTVEPPTTKGAFMKEFFKEVSAINGMLAKGRTNVKTMDEVLQDALQATTPERQKAVSEKLDDIVQDTGRYVHSIKTSLEELRRTSEEEEKAGLNAEQAKGHEIRKNMSNQLTRKHCQLLQDFQKAQINFKEALHQRQVREIHMVLPEATEDQVQDILADQGSLSLVVAQKMAGTHYALIDEVNRIQDKHQDILRLERSVADLAQMFTEMAVLVDSQGEMLDCIGVHVHKAKVYTAKAEENLITTRKAQHSAQRWMCCLAAVMMIVMLVILLPILIKKT